MLLYTNLFVCLIAKNIFIKRDGMAQHESWDFSWLNKRQSHHSGLKINNSVMKINTMKLTAAHAAHMQRRRLHRVSACAARAAGYHNGIAPKPTRLRFLSYSAVHLAILISVFLSADFLARRIFIHRLFYPLSFLSAVFMAD